MAQSLISGTTNYKFQGKNEILNDLNEILLNSQQLSENIDDISEYVYKLREIEIYGSTSSFDLYNYWLELGQFTMFLNQNIIPDILELVVCISENTLNENVIKKLEILSEKSWEFWKRFERVCPEIMGHTEEEINRIDDYSKVISVVTSVVDCGNMVDRLREFPTLKVERDNNLTFRSITLKACANLLTYLKNVQNERLEDEYNTYLKSLFEMVGNGLVVKDQTLRGESASGCSLGEIDLLLSINNRESVIEALKTSSLARQNIIEHINRLGKYDKVGNLENFIIVYYTGSNFEKFANNYLQLLKTSRLDFNISYIALNTDDSLSNIKVIDMYHNLNSSHSKITHILLNIWE